MTETTLTRRKGLLGLGGLLAVGAAAARPSPARASSVSPSDMLKQLASADCTTTLFRPAIDDKDYRNIDNGYLKGGVAISRCGRTYTGARICATLNEVPEGVNPVVDFRLCVWDYESHELRAMTDNLADAMNALPKGDAITSGAILVSGTFSASLALVAGEKVIVGDATYGDYPLRNIGLASETCKKAMMELPPQLGFVTQPTFHGDPTHRPTGGYEGGTPGSIGSDPSGNYPWMDLT
jgi:hypothetical protein